MIKRCHNSSLAALCINISFQFWELKCCAILMSKTKRKKANAFRCSLHTSYVRRCFGLSNWLLNSFQLTQQVRDHSYKRKMRRERARDSNPNPDPTESVERASSNRLSYDDSINQIRTVQLDPEPQAHRSEQRQGFKICRLLLLNSKKFKGNYRL